MVSTRSASRSASAAFTPSPTKPSSTARRTRSSYTTTNAWSHTPTTYTLAWLAISLPLVAWDTGYVLLRPHTMEGGSLHWPLYVPYKLYGTIDHVYGWKAWNANNGFTGAQGLMNLLETLMYCAYLYVWAVNGVEGVGVSGEGNRARKGVVGKRGAVMLAVGFAAAVMTLSKTVLYWMNEAYSGFDGIGHNSWFDLTLMWLIPNGAWIVGSAYMTLSMGSDIVNGLAMAPANVKSD